FRDRHARRLLDLLVQHERASLDGFEEGIKGEYLMHRRFLTLSLKDPRGWGEELDLAERSAGNAPPPNKDARIRDAEEISKKREPADIARINARFDDYFRGLLALRKTPIPQRREDQYHPRSLDDGSMYSQWTILLIPALRSAAEAEARALVQV